LELTHGSRVADATSERNVMPGAGSFSKALGSCAETAMAA
jgi:hypothetical protein